MKYEVKESTHEVRAHAYFWQRTPKKSLKQLLAFYQPAKYQFTPSFHSWDIATTIFVYAHLKNIRLIFINLYNMPKIELFCQFSMEM